MSEHATERSSSAPAVLMIHGFTGGPESFEPQVAHLRERGFEVAVPLLPGHGTSPADLATKSYRDFYDCAEEVLLEMAARRPVFVMGLSMGGTIAADLATSHSEMEGLILVNPLLVPPAPAYFSLMDQLLLAGAEFAPGVGSDIKRPQRFEKSYDSSPIRSAKSLFEAVAALFPRLEMVKVPILLFSSREDHVVPKESSDRLVEILGSQVRYVELENSYHVATLDNDADLISEGSEEFIRTLSRAS